MQWCVFICDWVPAMHTGLWYINVNKRVCWLFPERAFSSRKACVLCNNRYWHLNSVDLHTQLRCNNTVFNFLTIYFVLMFENNYLINVKLIVVVVLLLLLFFAHQHKPCGRKYLRKVLTAATATHSVDIVFWKETAFPCWRAMDRRWNRNTVSLASSVMAVIFVKSYYYYFFYYYFYFLQPPAQSRRLKIKQLRLDMALTQIWTCS